jgi:hypothetical protein
MWTATTPNYWIIDEVNKYISMFFVPNVGVIVQLQISRTMLGIYIPNIGASRSPLSPRGGAEVLRPSLSRRGGRWGVGWPVDLASVSVLLRGWRGGEDRGRAIAGRIRS